MVSRCCCFSLKTGCVIISIIDALLIGILWLFTYMPQQPPRMSTYSDNELLQHGPLNWVFALAIIAAGCLFYGAFKEKRHFLWPWISVHVLIACVLSIAMLSALFVTNFFGLSLTEMGLFGLGLAVYALYITILIAFVIFILVIDVVCSHYRELSTREQMTQLSQYHKLQLLMQA